LERVPDPAGGCAVPRKYPAEFAMQRQDSHIAAVRPGQRRELLREHFGATPDRAANRAGVTGYPLPCPFLFRQILFVTFGGPDRNDFLAADLCLHRRNESGGGIVRFKFHGSSRNVIVGRPTALQIAAATRGRS